MPGILEDANGLIEGDVSRLHLKAEAHPQGVQHLDFLVIRVGVHSLLPIRPGFWVVAVIRIFLLSKGREAKTNDQQEDEHSALHVLSLGAWRTHLLAACRSQQGVQRGQ
jgi:hypothetical protein